MFCTKRVFVPLTRLSGLRSASRPQVGDNLGCTLLKERKCHLEADATTGFYASRKGREAAKFLWYNLLHGEIFSRFLAKLMPLATKDAEANATIVFAGGFAALRTLREKLCHQRGCATSDFGLSQRARSREVFMVQSTTR